MPCGEVADVIHWSNDLGNSLIITQIFEFHDPAGLMMITAQTLIQNKPAENSMCQPA